MHTEFSLYFPISFFDPSSLAVPYAVALIGRQTVSSLRCYLLSVLPWMVWLVIATLI